MTTAPRSSHGSMDIRIRPFLDDDEAFALRLASAEGWDTTPETIAALRRHDPEGWFVGEADGRRAGIVSTTRCPDSAWIGHVIVLPEFRRRGLGTLLTRRAIQCLEDAGSRTIRLEADPPAVAIYRRLGWETEWESARLRRPGRETGGAPDQRTGGAAASAQPATDTDPGADATLTGAVVAWSPASELPESALQLDRTIAGYDRAPLLLEWASIARGGWLVDGGRGGFAMILPAAAGVRLGPWVATDIAAAEALLQAAVTHHGDRPLLVGTPSLNRDALELLGRFGFELEDPSERMVRGRRVAVGEPERLYGIASGATG